MVLLNLGQPEQALEILMTTPELAWDPYDSIQQRINEACVWIQALDGCGRDAEAAVWRERLTHTLQQRGDHRLPWIVRRVALSAPVAETPEPSRSAS